MGVISIKAFENESSTSYVPYYLIDKYITLNDFLMKDKTTTNDILSSYPDLNIRDALREKEITVKKRHFSKWYKMSYTTYKNPFEQETIQNLLSSENDSSLQNESNEQLLFKTSISEQSMREYYTLNQEHYESRIIRAPPVQFRWLSWLIATNVPANRLDEGYLNLLKYPLPSEDKTQIQTIIDNYLKQNTMNSLALKESAFNVTKAILCFDKEIDNKESIIALVCFLLIMSGRNETEVFYVLLSLLSGTFKSHFSMKYLLCGNHPIMNVLLHMYNEMCNKHLKKLMAFFNEKNYSLENLFEQYFKLCFLNGFIYTNVIRIFDCFFVKGLSFFVSLALSMTDFLQKNILKTQEEKEIFDLFTKFSSQASETNTSSDFKFDIEDLINTALQKYAIKPEDYDNELQTIANDVNVNFAYEFRNIPKAPEQEEEKEVEEKEEKENSYEIDNQQQQQQQQSEHNDEASNKDDIKNNNNNFGNTGYAQSTIITMDLVVDNDGDEEDEIIEHVKQISNNIVSLKDSNPFTNKRRFKQIE